MVNGFKNIEQLYGSVTFDDVLLVPQYSTVGSRTYVDIATDLSSKVSLQIPILASNMDSVCELEMATVLAEMGGVGVIHRYMSIEDRALILRELYIASYRAVAIGLREVKQVDKLLKERANILVIDVAHGDHEKVIEVVKEIRNLYGSDLTIVAGNIVTGEAAEKLIEAGTDTIKVGIGSGSICTTRTVTGHGYPQLSAIYHVREWLEDHGITNVKIIADGGIKSSGDIVKALAAGADTVMLGGLLAGTDESPGDIFVKDNRKYKMYRGMASRQAQEQFYGNSPDAPEGIVTVVPYKGSAKTVIRTLCGGIKSGLSYSGARSIKELREKASWVGVSPAGRMEALTLTPYE